MNRNCVFPTKITHLLATFLIILFLFSSCRREVIFTGEQCFENFTNEPIDLYIDGFYEFTINDFSGACITLEVGCWDWYVEGVFSGFFSEGTFCISDGGFGSTIVIEF